MRNVCFEGKTKLASRDFPAPLGRKYFRLVEIEHLDDSLVGELLVIAADMFEVMPAGVLLDTHKRYFRIKSPETGQILCLNYDDCTGFTSPREIQEDIMNAELQEQPESYTNDFIPRKLEDYSLEAFCKLPYVHRYEIARRISKISTYSLAEVMGFLEKGRNGFNSGFRERFWREQIIMATYLLNLLREYEDREKG